MRLIAFAITLLVAPVHAQDICQAVADERTSYGPTISPAEAVVILNAAAYAHRPDWGLLEAPPGGNGWAHPSGRRVRLDRLVRRFDQRIFDVFTDGPDSRPGEPERSGTAGPGCQDDGAVSGVYIVEPVPPAGAPPPVIPTDSLDALLMQLLEHSAQMQAGIDSLRLQLASHTQKLESLAADHSKQPTVPESDAGADQEPERPWWVKLLTLWILR